MGLIIGLGNNGSGGGSMKQVIVDELPDVGKSGIVYLVPKDDPELEDAYDEYIWIKQTSSWEKIGTTHIDLTNYVSVEQQSFTEVQKALARLNIGAASNSGIPELPEAIVLQEDSIETALLPIKFITNKNGEKFYPKTHINAVVDDDNLRLSDILKEELTDATNVIGEAIAKIYNEYKVLKDIVLSASYNTINATNYTCMKQPFVIIGSGAPSVPPKFVGLRYHDNTNKKVYEAFNITNSINDWVLLN